MWRPSPGSACPGTAPELLGDSHSDVATSLGTLGTLLSRSGQLPAAEAALTEALAIASRLPSWTNGLVTSLTDLATLYQERGEPPRAADLARGARGPRAALGPSIRGSAGVNHLAMTLFAGQPRRPTAAPRGLRLHRRGLGEDHPAVAATLENLAGLLAERGDFAAAEPLAREALALHRKKLGGRHPKVGGGINTLAVLLHSRGDLAGAEELFREALALRREILPPEHPETAASLVGLGAVLADRGEEREAEPLLREALAMRRHVLPPGHWRIAAAESGLEAASPASAAGRRRDRCWSKAIPGCAKRSAPTTGRRGGPSPISLGSTPLLPLVPIAGRPTSRSAPGRPTAQPGRPD